MELLFDILFNPVQTFRNINTDKPYKLPLLIIVLIAITLAIVNEPSFSIMTLFGLIPACVALICYWLFFAFFVDLMAKLFDVKSQFSKLLTLTSFSFVPWIFLAPLKLLKGFNPITNALSVFMILGIWCWVIALQILAISETYNIERKNALLILILPFLGGMLYLTWLVDFFVKMFQFSSL